jgi:hypothetical protein
MQGENISVPYKSFPPPFLSLFKEKESVWRKEKRKGCTQYFYKFKRRCQKT